MRSYRPSVPLCDIITSLLFDVRKRVKESLLRQKRTKNDVRSLYILCAATLIRCSRSQIRSHPMVPIWSEINLRAFSAPSPLHGSSGSCSAPPGLCIDARRSIGTRTSSSSSPEPSHTPFREPRCSPHHSITIQNIHKSAPEDTRAFRDKDSANASRNGSKIAVDWLRYWNVLMGRKVVQVLCCMWAHVHRAVPSGGIAAKTFE